MEENKEIIIEEKLKTLLKNQYVFYNCLTDSGVANEIDKYIGDPKKTSLEFNDIVIKHENNKGEIISESADILNISVLYKGNKYSSFCDEIKPRIDYDLEIIYSVDGIQKKSILNLKYSTVFEQSRKSISLINKKDIFSSIRIELGYNDYYILRSFLGILFRVNPYSSKSNANIVREKKSIIDTSDFGFNMINNFKSNHNIKSYNNSVITDPYGELDKLIGLDAIKEDVKKLVNFMKLQKRRKEKGLTNVPVSLHLVFTGNPGTGKTTIARIIGAIYKDIGVLSKGHFVEVDRAALVAGYIGQTAMKTQKKIEEAMGGVLFIDEAYTLAKQDAPNDFGQEAIDTILKAMEDNRDDFVVIVAGYPDLMKNFINSNPGLQSRFNKYIEFPDYTSEEMFLIFKKMCDQYDYVIKNEAYEKMRLIFENVVNHKDDSFANARTVRNIFETLITNQADRLSEVDATEEEMQEISIDDINKFLDEISIKEC